LILGDVSERKKIAKGRYWFWCWTQFAS